MLCVGKVSLRLICDGDNLVIGIKGLFPTQGVPGDPDVARRSVDHLSGIHFDNLCMHLRRDVAVVTQAALKLPVHPRKP